jgi:hypothetical protein
VGAKEPVKGRQSSLVRGVALVPTQSSRRVFQNHSRPGSVQEARRTIAQVAAPPAAHGTARGQRLADLPAAMQELEQVEHGLSSSGFAHQREAGGFAAGVNLQAQGLKVRSFGLTVDEPDNERQDAMDACPATVEE